MFRPQPWLLLLFFSTSLLFGFRGTIYDEEGRPIEGATITDHYSIVFSDAQGTFRINAQADSLYITRVGFEAKTVPASSRNITLNAVPIELPSVWVRAEPILPLSPSLSADLIHPDTNAPAQGVAQLLQRSAAFGSTDIQLTGEKQTLSILGSFGRHSLVMMDGVVQNASGEACDLSKIPFEQVDYIEIIKGSASVYGGSSAIGGIIHIHTKKASQRPSWESSASFKTGSFGMIGHGYDAALKYKKLSLSVGYSHYHADNDYLYDTPDFWQSEPELKRLHNRKIWDSFFLKTGYLKGPVMLEYTLNAGSFVRQLPGPINFLELYDDARLTGNFQQHSLNGSFAHKSYAQEARIWLNRDGSVYRNLASTIPITKSHYGQNQNVSGFRSSHHFSLEDTRLAVNLEVQRTDYDFLKPPHVTESSVKRDNSAISASAQQLCYPFLFKSKTSLAGRADYSEKTVHPTWRLEQELTWPGVIDLTLGGYLGTSFAQPSLFDMYWIGDAQTQGNPNLKSESSSGYSVFAAISHAGFRLKTAVYKNQVKELIQWRQYFLNGMSWKPFNVGSAQLKSYEIEAELPLESRFNISASIIRTQAIDKSKNPDGSPSPTFDKYLVYTPDWKANLQFAYTNQSHGAAINYGYTGKQYSTADNLIQPLQAFDKLDASIYWQPKIWILDWKLDLLLNNILNRRYEIYSYTPQPGFNWTLGLTLSYHK